MIDLTHTHLRTCGEFEVGDRVVVFDDATGSVSDHAHIRGFYSDIPGGLYLDREVHGFRSWNIENCRRV